VVTSLAGTDTPFIAGIDHAFGFAISYFERWDLSPWDGSLEDFGEYCPTHEPHVYVDFIRDRGPTRIGWPTDFRLCDGRTSSPKSVFRFDVRGQVAKSVDAGIPWLWPPPQGLGDRVYLWPLRRVGGPGHQLGHRGGLPLGLAQPLSV
jgi:hypothetical protein